MLLGNSVLSNFFDNREKREKINIQIFMIRQYAYIPRNERLIILLCVTICLHVFITSFLVCQLGDVAAYKRFNLS